ncbi:MAG TPA: energy transducer TonB [Blastocatellia bacterium]|nr:energy transducer TonB [Blastocatellia bacterium]
MLFARRALAIASLYLILSLIFSASTQHRLRIAVLDFQGGDEKHSVEIAMRSALTSDERTSVVDPSQIEAALAAGSTSSLNLTTDEARQIGATIGCDAYVLGKVFVERSSPDGHPSFEVFVALFLVDARTGQLVKFVSLSENSDSVASVLSKTVITIKAQAKPLIDQMIAFREQQSELSSTGSDNGVEDLPEENTPEAKGFTPPQFFRRYTPNYTALAAHAEVTATVDLNVLFRADGSIGEIAVTRWAGYGLDEAAIETVRSMKFQPATRNGKPISVRAPVRYNFRSK